jgi:hypothetical protein
MTVLVVGGVVAGMGAIATLATGAVATLTALPSAATSRAGPPYHSGGLSDGGSSASNSGVTVAEPAGMFALYHQAAADACPGLSWSVLAAIGTVESGNGTSNLPGVHMGTNSAGAEGPMQFEPATFSKYDRPIPSGGADPPSPYDPTDAVYAAARMLCADGATQPGGLTGAIFAYNHAWWYVSEVLDLASLYAKTSGGAG